MSNQTNNFGLAVRAFQRQDYVEARRLLIHSEPRQAAHLRGLVERRLGNLVESRRFLEEALKYEPKNHEILHNQALLMLDLGSPASALSSLKSALALKPDFAAAQRTFGRALREAGHWQEAKSHYQALLQQQATAAGSISGQMSGQKSGFEFGLEFGLASAELELGEIETALHRFGRLLEEGTDESAVYFMHGRAALEAGQEDKARSSLETAHSSGPTALTLRELARLYWMLGERDAFEGLFTHEFPSSELATVAMELLRLSGATPDAVAAAGGSGNLNAAQEAILAQTFVDAADPENAFSHATRCLAIEPHHDSGMAALICSLLMSGRANEALTLTRQMQKRQPNAQQWIAYEATALRIVDPVAYARLVDIDAHVRQFSLPVPEGYADIADFNEALLAALDRLQVFEAQPIDQSLRLGTQTARDLTSVDDPVIQAYLSALDQPIRAYMDAIGTDPSHPLSRRNTGEYRLNGCWSVRLTGGGYHVNHMHPEGWISSAYYVSVPQLDSEDRSGWIKFSEPPFRTSPALEPERWVKPSAGMLVLFPSFLWHGTAPIVDDAVRVTAPFDAVPK